MTHCMFVLKSNALIFAISKAGRRMIVKGKKQLVVLTDFLLLQL